MKEYSHFTAVDFALDDQFVKWAKYPGHYPEVDRHWAQFLAQYPEKAYEVEEAKRMIFAVHDAAEDALVSQQQEETWRRLSRSIAADESSDPTTGEQELTGSPRPWWKTSYSIAATVVLVLCSTFLAWQFAGVTGKRNTSLADGYDKFIKEINNSDEPKTVVLADGSSIILQPNSTLQYPKAFKQEYREVILAGEGFFEVAKDTQRPFIVYADKLVTKVLGTSFTIRAFADEQDVLVQVKTGKVSVFTDQDVEANKTKGDAQLEGVLLIPNQQVIFSRKEARLVKSLVENPALLNESVKRSFVFQDAPLKEVFESLEQAYGVDIVYDEELMSACSINAYLDDMPLYDKLRLICKTLEVQYEILDSHIIVTGKGCKE